MVAGRPLRSVKLTQQRKPQKPGPPAVSATGTFASTLGAVALAASGVVSGTATAVTLSGPNSVVQGQASTYTVALNGAASTVTVTITAIGLAGTLSTPTVIVNSGSPSATFTFTPAASGSGTLSITNNAGLANLGSPLAISTAAAFTTTHNLITTASSATYPTSWGMGFKKGDVPASIVVSGMAGYQVTALRRWNDGSLKHARITGRVALTQNVSKQLSITAGTPPTGTNLTAASIQAANPSASIACGAFGTVNLSGLLASPFRTIESGPELADVLYRADVGSSLMSAWFQVRLHADNRMFVRAWVENGYLDNGAGAISAGVDRSYVPTITINGSVVFTFAQKAITAITQTANGDGTFFETVTTSTPHGLVDAQACQIAGVLGMTGINGQRSAFGIISATQFRTNNHSGSYTAYTSGGTVDFAQPEFTSYKAEAWIGGDPLVLPQHNVAYLNTTKLVPPYGWTSPTVFSTTAYAPMGHGDLTPAMGATGSQDQIGLLPKWDALAAASGDTRAFKAMIVNSDSLRSYATTWRSKASQLAPRPTDFPTWTIDGPGQGGSNGPGAGSLAWETSHFPNSGYLPYLLTGDWWHYETMLLQAALCYLVITSALGSGVNRVLTSQTRSAAWMLRNLSALASIYPTGETVGADYQSLLNSNINHWEAVRTTPGANQIGLLYEYTTSAYTANGGDGFVATWQQNFWAQSLGFGSDLEPLASMTSYVSVRDWLYRWPVGLLGTAAGYPFAWASDYTAKITDAAPSTDPTTFYDTFAQVRAGSLSFYPSLADGATLQGTSGSSPAIPDGYWANLMPAISYAAEHKAAGAAAAHARLLQATNYATLRDAGFDNMPVWGVKPRWPSWRKGMVPWQWKAIPGTSMSGVNPTTIPAVGNYNNTGPPGRIDAYCGLACDPAGRLYSPANGGHQDYSGNEMVMCDLWQESPAWTILRQPSPDSAWLLNSAYYSDGRPTASHTYYTTHFVPAQGALGKVFRFGCGFSSGSGAYADGTAAFDIATNDWDGAGTNQNSSPFWPNAQGSSGPSGQAQDALSGDVYYSGNSTPGRLRRFNAATGTFTDLAPVPGVNNDFGYYRPWIYDHTRGRLLTMGNAYSPSTGGLLWTNNGGAGSWSSITFGTSDFAGSNGFGAKYDPLLDRIVCKTPAGATVLLVNPVTFAVTNQPTTGAVPPNPQPNAPNVFGRFHKVPGLGGYVYYPLYSDTCYFLATE